MPCQNPNCFNTESYKTAFRRYLCTGETADLKHQGATETAFGWPVPANVNHAFHNRPSPLTPLPPEEVKTIKELEGKTDNFLIAKFQACMSVTRPFLDYYHGSLAEWLAMQTAPALTAEQDKAFITGDGIGDPLGFLAYPMVAESAWSWGNIGFITTGAAGDFPADYSLCKLGSLACALKSGYRQNGTFLMNRGTYTALSKLEFVNDYLRWVGPEGNRISQLMHFPIYLTEAMPSMSDGSFSIAFGDFRSGYLAVDLGETWARRAVFPECPLVRLTVTQTVCGGVQDFDAIKLLKFAV